MAEIELGVGSSMADDVRFGKSDSFESNQVGSEETLEHLKSRTHF